MTFWIKLQHELLCFVYAGDENNNVHMISFCIFIFFKFQIKSLIWTRFQSKLLLMSSTFILKFNLYRRPSSSE